MKFTKKSTIFLTIVFLFTGFSIVYGATNEESALSWQKNAKDTRAAVVSVYGELEKIGDKGNPDAKGLIADAVKWLGEGDKELAKGDEAMTKNEWESASYNYNMAWQYYVKAATAGLNAKRILTGM